MRRGLVSIIVALQAYGHLTNTFTEPHQLTKNIIGRHTPHLAALKEKFIDIMPAYMGTLRSELNPHFRMLLSQRRSFKVDLTSYLFGIYTVHASRALWLAVDMVYLAAKKNKRVLFISDKETESELGVQSINCLLYEPHIHSIVSQLSKISFYYNSRIRTLFPAGFINEQYFDLVVVCLKDYTRVNRTTFQHYARFTLGFCAQNMRPDIFDYYVPAMGTYQASVALLRDIAVLGYLAR